MEKGKEGKSVVGEHVALNTLWCLGYLFVFVYVHHMYMDLFAAFSLALSAVGASVHSHGDLLRLSGCSVWCLVRTLDVAGVG